MNFSRWRTLPEYKIHLDRGLSSAEMKTAFWEVRVLPVRFVFLYRLITNIELSDFPSVSFSFYQLLYRQATKSGVYRLPTLSLVIKFRINRFHPTPRKKMFLDSIESNQEMFMHPAILKE
jgi:hypothetical protein